MTMWRDEFLARERIAERERSARDAARVRNLLSGDHLPAVPLSPDRGTARRAVARLLAASARGALSIAHRLDAGIELDLERGRRIARG